VKELEGERALERIMKYSLKLLETNPLGTHWHKKERRV
jgi:hypothetical protein